jgi:hypothetical protein
LQEFIEQLNKDQLKTGYDSEDIFLGYYKPSTLKRKARSGGKVVSKNNEIALYDTGKFWNSIVSNVVGYEIILNAKDEKLSILKEVHTQNILGLNSSNKNKLTEKFCNVLALKIKNYVL